MSIQLILQPPNSFCCGQATVAMILGMTLNGAVNVFRHRHKTRTKDLVRVLNDYQIPNGGKLVKKKTSEPFPVRCIIRLRSSEWKNWSHWVVLWDGVLYDPALGADPAYEGHIKMTSSLSLVE